MSYTEPRATDRQVSFILDLLDKRDTKMITDPAYALVAQRLLEVEPEVDPENDVADHRTPRITLMRHLTKLAASQFIDHLLKCRVVPLPTTADHSELSQIMASLPLSKYALPRRDGSGWDFFELVERKNGRRWLNRLLGAPGDWCREFMQAHLMLAASRAIAKDPLASAVAYAEQHGRCSVCDSPLSNPTSIEQSMGPVCAKKFA